MARPAGSASFRLLAVAPSPRLLGVRREHPYPRSFRIRRASKRSDLDRVLDRGNRLDGPVRPLSRGSSSRGPVRTTRAQARLYDMGAKAVAAFKHATEDHIAFKSARSDAQLAACEYVRTRSATGRTGCGRTHRRKSWRLVILVQGVAMDSSEIRVGRLPNCSVRAWLEEHRVTVARLPFILISTIDSDRRVADMPWAVAKGRSDFGWALSTSPLVISGSSTVDLLGD